MLLGSIIGSVIILAGLVAGGYAAAAVPDGTPYLEVARTSVYLLVVSAAIAVGGGISTGVAKNAVTAPAWSGRTRPALIGRIAITTHN